MHKALRKPLIALCTLAAIAVPALAATPAEIRVSANAPFDASYAQLTAAQKQALLALYPDLPAADEPPYPAGGNDSIVNALMGVASKLSPEGKLLGTVTVSAEGQATAVNFFDLPKVGSSQEAASMEKLLSAGYFRARYKPGLCGGQPCEMDYPVIVEFKAY